MTLNTVTAGHPDRREHHWDALRAFLMLLGIPYHVAMAYRANDMWILNTGQGDLLFTWLAAIIHLFRMPAFFVIAGYFAAVLLMRRLPEMWFKQRFIRLGLPFLTCLLTLNPLLNLFCELSNFQLGGALASWERNSLVSGGYWVRHLWFIIVLLYLCGAAALLCQLAPRAGRALLPSGSDAWMSRNIQFVIMSGGVAIGLWQAGAIEAFYVAGLATNLPQEILRIDQLIACAPWFAAGWLIARAPRLREAIYRPSLSIALIGLIATVIYLRVGTQVHPMVERFIATIAGTAATQLLLASFKRFAGSPYKGVQALVSGSFVIYLFHLPIMAGLIMLGQQVAMSVVPKGMLIMALTLALSWGAWLIVRTSPTLRLLYDGVAPTHPARIARIAPRKQAHKGLHAQ